MTIAEQFVNAYRKEIEAGLASQDVLEFISHIHEKAQPDENDVLHRVFANGYCFYFAHMLKIAFNRGQVMLAAPRGHIVWVDDDGCAYDIDGIFKDYCFEIPIDALGNGIEDFMHVSGKDGFNSLQDIINLCKTYAPTKQLLDAALSELGVNIKEIEMEK